MEKPINNNQTMELVKLAKYAGSRLDLAQAGGGNASVKIDDFKMLVTQAWGCTLTETEINTGYVCVMTNEIKNALNNDKVINAKTLDEKNKIANALVKQANESPDIKPTAEVYLHALLPFKFSLHLHPIVVNSIVVQKDAEQLLQSYLPEMGFVNYSTPGLEVSLLFKDYVDDLKKKNIAVPNVVFMKNHGLMVGAETVKEVINIVENILDKLETKLGVNYMHFRNASRIAELVNSLNSHINIAYLSTDIAINHNFKHNQPNFFSKPTYPDQFIYNGLLPLIIDSISTNKLKDYKDSYGAYPKVIVYQDSIYFIANNLNQAKQMEDVFRSHVLLLQNIIHSNNIDYLTSSQINKIKF